MIDYFALLGQPRQPWLEGEELKKRYQTLIKTAHPDQAANNPSDQAFA
jgi:curved DNA-binding protein CbpA